LQIAKDADLLGGNLNAFTGRESVGFHNEVVDEDLVSGFELLADLVTAPAFDSAELEKERNVILEEIKMVEDTPDDVLFDVFCERFYPDHPLGRRVLGTPETLATFRDERVWHYYQDLFSPENLVVAAAGNLKHEEVLDLGRALFRPFAQTSRGSASLGAAVRCAPDLAAQEGIGTGAPGARRAVSVTFERGVLRDWYPGDDLGQWPEFALVSICA
jgi:predicted Zn-dependent peptidase